MNYYEEQLVRSIEEFLESIDEEADSELLQDKTTPAYHTQRYYKALQMVRNDLRAYRQVYPKYPGRKNG